ncbi:MAG: hypothetical protein ACOYNS_10400 [Bacteroidota bacterium]
MLILWAAFITAIYFIKYLQYENLKTSLMEFSAQIEDIRDRLRELAINGRVNKNELAFNHFDKLLTASRNNLENLSIWKVIPLSFLPPPQEIVDTHKKFRHELLSAKNKDINVLFEEYSEILTGVLWFRHRLLRVLRSLVRISSSSVKAIRAFRKKWQKAKEYNFDDYNLDGSYFMLNIGEHR